jgi:hypothetical protein
MYVVFATALVAGCSRADEVVAFVNDCEMLVSVETEATGQAYAIAPGEAFFKTFRDQPELLVRVGAGSTQFVLDVDTSRWEEQTGPDTDGVVLVRGDQCISAGTLELTPLPADESKELFWKRDPRFQQ